MGRFIFYFASQAYYDPLRGDGGAFPAKGVEDYGNIVHEYNIPVTWLTNTKGAELGKDLFTKFHEDHGDEVILWGLPFLGENTSQKRDYVLGMNTTDIEKYLREEQAGILEHIPWARVDHCGFFYRTRAAIQALLAVGMKSVYGHCWEMIATDGVTDAGTPWGFYFIDPNECWKRPNSRDYENRKLVANEWLQHDLNKSWNYYGSCSVFSWDPNDVGRAMICDGRSIDYWKAGFREYYNNRLWNDFIPFVFHQEAHEQESTPGGWEVYDQATVDNTAEMTDEFLAFITSGDFPDMEIITLPDAAEEYARLFKMTPPTAMLFRDIPITSPEWERRKVECLAIYKEAKADEEADGETLDYEQDYGKLSYLFPYYGWQGLIHENSYPESLVYCDLDVQLFFHEGRVQPVKLWNYHTEIDLEPRNLYFNEYLFRDPTADGVQVEVEEGPGQVFSIQITSPGYLPYGICLWREFSHKNWATEVLDHPSKCELVRGLKLIDNRALVIRLDLVDKTSRVKIFPK